MAPASRPRQTCSGKAAGWTVSPAGALSTSNGSTPGPGQGETDPTADDERCDALLGDLTHRGPPDLPGWTRACVSRLRPDGLLLVACRDATYGPQVQAELGAAALAALEDLQTPGGSSTTPDALRAVLQAAGLSIERVEPVGTAPTHGSRAPGPSGLLAAPDRFVIAARLPLLAAAPTAAAAGCADEVEVVLPVFNALPSVQRCLAALLQSEPRRRWRLTVIDDASTDPAVAPALRSFAREHPAVRVLHNAVNLGYAGTTNLGMRLAGRRDVILLNSDAVVPPGWIGRLQRAAYSHARAGSVTPFSNNASICSFPRICEENPLPHGVDAMALDRLFATHLKGQTLEIPTAVGFCVYLRRDCLDEIGLFDERTFGAGYGEEDDFCMRARSRGWRHLHLLDLFVVHEGAMSFGPRRLALQEQAIAAMRLRYPFYESLVHPFIRQDPARQAREQILRLLDNHALGSPPTAA